MQETFEGKSSLRAAGIGQRPQGSGSQRAVSAKGIADRLGTTNKLGFSKQLHNARIGIDLMGATLAPEAIIVACRAAAGQAELLFAADKGTAVRAKNCLIAPDTLRSDEGLLSIRKKENSLALLLKKLRKGELDVVISANHTAAVVAQSRFILKMDGPKACAFLTYLPACKGKKIAILDLGANLEATANHLLHFAELGAAFLKKKKLSIGLLNIGEEKQKGPAHWRKAYELIERFCAKSGYQFRGNVEPSTLFRDPVDLLVTDAVAGNILLKTAEGVASMILKELKVSAPTDFEWSSYPGALLVGVTKPVIKVHGYATESSFVAALGWAKTLIS